MLSGCALIAFGVTTDPERTKDFYGRVLGLELSADEPWALVFDAHGTMLRIQKLQTFTPAPFTLLGWRVQDLEGYARRLGAAGVTMTRYAGFDQDELGIWRAPGGTKIAWFKDPDGNTLSLTEF
jgi:predicted enzyme related to lactoylglutathione lyase